MNVWSQCDNVASGNSGGSPAGTCLANAVVFDASGKSYTFKDLTAGTAAFSGVYDSTWLAYVGGFNVTGIPAALKTVWEVNNVTDLITERHELSEYRTATGGSGTVDEIKGFVMARKCGTLDINLTIETRINGPASTNGSLANGYFMTTCDYSIYQGATVIVASTPMVACLNDHQAFGKDASFTLPAAGTYQLVVRIVSVLGTVTNETHNFTITGSTLCTVPTPPAPSTGVSVTKKNNGVDLVYFEPECGTASGACMNAGYEVGLVSGCGIWKKKDGTTITSGGVLFDTDLPLKLDASGCGHGEVSELPYRCLTTGGCGAGAWAILKSYTVATPVVSVSSIRNPCTNVCECVAVITGLVPDLTDVLIYDAATAVDFDSPATNLIASANMMGGTATVIVPCSSKIKAYFKF